MFHTLPPGIADLLKQVDLFLQDLRLRVNHTDDADLREGGGGGGGGREGKDVVWSVGSWLGGT